MAGKNRFGVGKKQMSPLVWQFDPPGVVVDDEEVVSTLPFEQICCHFLPG